jgi:hypothetical protein
MERLHSRSDFERAETTLSSAHGLPSTIHPSASPRATESGPTRAATPIPAIITASRIDTTESTAADLAPPACRWREVLTVTLVPALVALFVVPDDPLLIQGNFPWLVLVPLLVGVQHGALAATLSSGLLLGVGGLQLFVSKPETLHAALPTLAAFGGGCVAVGVIAGYHHDRVQAQLSRLSLQAVDTARRLARLSRAHAVVKLSHRRLEERLAAGSWSLVSAFDEARRELGRATSLSAVAEVVLNVLSNHAMVQSATLLGVVSVDRRGGVELRPSASIGNPPATDLRHPLVQRALSTGRLVALDAETSDANVEREQTVLAVAPLVSASGKVLGLVLIHELPFMAFQAESLKGLAALTALLADMLEDHSLAHQTVAHQTGADASAADPSVAHRSVESQSVENDSWDNDSLEKFFVEDFPTEDFSVEDFLVEDFLVENPAVAEPESGEAHVGDASGDATGSSDGDFVGHRTGTHRRRGVAQSA